MLVHCFSKGFLITYGQLYLKQSSATRRKCIMLNHKVGTIDQKLCTCWSWKKTKKRADQRVIYLLVIEENE
jgi:hypothetical protein